MPKANLQVLKSPAIPFHKEECLVCGERFLRITRVKDFKADMLKQFDAHLFTHQELAGLGEAMLAASSKNLSAWLEILFHLADHNRSPTTASLRFIISCQGEGRPLTVS